QVTTQPFIEVDHGPGGRPARFERPARIIRADTPGEVPAALTALDGARAAGAWVAGYAAYELGHVFEPRLAPLLPEGRSLPLLEFGVFDGPVPVAPPPAAAHMELGGFCADWDLPAYRMAFARAADYIRAGD